MRSLKIIIFVAPFLLLTTLFSANESNAGKVITFASYKIPMLVENESEGILSEIIQTACKRLNVVPHIKIYPPKRALKSFYNQKVEGIFPSLDIPDSKNAYKTIPIHHKTAFAFTVKSKTPPANISELKGLIIGLTRGYSYPKSITENPLIKVDWADSFPASLNKLLLGRIDCFIGDPDITIKVIQKMHLQLSYNLKHPLFKEPAVIAFQRTPKGAMQAKDFNRVLKNMEKDGTMAKIKFRLLDVAHLNP
ncbi:substrate-binding periplasmic protein [Maridesulfovibrio hydrothermalis]|uniref:Solute-binding protein family 3/N-terminal domain-containing protein n=1 Tax=Maridesulfovibrio hydrothermalis AM13 = DSM 14728 TaxID=1121451 RepID=L0RC35_9BACT|nr:transporter substrate-binding domain-containing protein [Maridesulfovibrio hydrothermalis]CCO23782.1 conserved exported protein of unknown function [Maridesulfovibrio hydrothermalis AM13 = DSM 14728]